jgi:hypothetical protein
MLSVEVAVNHTVKSTASARNVIITVRLPPFLKYKDLISTKPKAATAVKVTEGIQFKVKIMYFAVVYLRPISKTVRNAYSSVEPDCELGRN